MPGFKMSLPPGMKEPTVSTFNPHLPTVFLCHLAEQHIAHSLRRSDRQKGDAIHHGKEEVTVQTSWGMAGPWFADPLGTPSTWAR